jgi:hypothetical protein
MDLAVILGGNRFDLVAKTAFDARTFRPCGPGDDSAGGLPGELMLVASGAQINTSSTNYSFSEPTGWTLSGSAVGSAGFPAGTSRFGLAVMWKRLTGAETGLVGPVNAKGGSTYITHVWRIRGGRTLAAVNPLSSNSGSLITHNQLTSVLSRPTVVFAARHLAHPNTTFFEPGEDDVLITNISAAQDRLRSAVAIDNASPGADYVIQGADSGAATASARMCSLIIHGNAEA